MQKCKVVDSSVLVRQKARDQSGGNAAHRRLCCMYTHLMLQPLSLQSSLHPSFIGPQGRHAYQWFMRDGGEGMRDWEKYRGIEGGLGSAVRPRQQLESIKSVGLPLH